MSRERWGATLWPWIISTVALLASTVGPIQLMVGPRGWGALWCGVGVLGWWVLAHRQTSQPNRELIQRDQRAGDEQEVDRVGCGRG